MLPDKPEQLKDVSDRLWEAGWQAALSEIGYDEHDWGDFLPFQREKGNVDAIRLATSLAAHLIKSGQVEEPRDPLDEAIDGLFVEWCSGAFDTDTFRKSIRTHLGPFLKGEG